MPCAASVSSLARASLARTQALAPICCAVGTDDGYSMQPVSSFTSMTNAFTSVSSASRTSCHSLDDPNAQALT